MNLDVTKPDCREPCTMYAQTETHNKSMRFFLPCGVIKRAPHQDELKLSLSGCEGWDNAHTFSGRGSWPR